MLNKATELGLLTPICNRKTKLRISLFADDAAIFLNPVNEEVEAVKNILCAFATSSGLVTNSEKVQFTRLDVRALICSTSWSLSGAQLNPSLALIWVYPCM